MMDAIKENSLSLGVKPKQERDISMPLKELYQGINDHVVEAQLNELIGVLSKFQKGSKNQVISEVDLRRLLNAYMYNLTDQHLNVLVDEVREWVGEQTLVRHFKVTDVI